ncbi:MAG: trehalose-phosphatase, partial [Acidobacteriota bacterium]
MAANQSLEDRLRELARTPTLLVASDYDGTLSPIVDDPQLAYPERESVAALRALADLVDTHVVVVSGRSLRDLAALSRLPSEIRLVGSHGSEFDAGFATALSPETIALRETVTRRLAEIAARDSGFHVEKKPASAAFHYRNAPPSLAETALTDILEGPGALSGVSVKRGKMVVELTVVDTSKGSALDLLRRQVAADAVIFLGDDVTDEDGFKALRGPDVGVKVGPEETTAEFRVHSTPDVARVLAHLDELRRAWLEGGAAAPIEQHSLLSDQRTVALVTPDANINWLCHPRADSPAVFAELIGGPHAGFFAVQPAHGASPLSQRYVGSSLVLETRWAGLTVTDYLDTSGGRPEEPPGHTNLVRVLEGDTEAVIEFAPRLDYGRAATGIDIREGALVVRGTSQNIRLHWSGASMRWSLEQDGPHQTAIGHVELSGKPLVLDLAFEATGAGRAEATRRRGTENHWSEWAQELDLPSTQRDAVLRSALTIKALCHEPTGAILA